MKLRIELKFTNSSNWHPAFNDTQHHQHIINYLHKRGNSLKFVDYVKRPSSNETNVRLISLIIPVQQWHLIPQFSKIAALAYNVGTTVNAN
jgi:hypothetical protein